MKVKKETIIRTVILLITLVNTILIMLGKNPLPFAEEDIYTCLSTLAAAAATLWSWWKNNSFTQRALEADEYMNMLKQDEKGDNPEVEEKV